MRDIGATYPSLEVAYPSRFDDDRPLPKKKIHPKAILVKVQVFDKDDNMIRDHDKDFRRSETRKWLNGMLLWAIRNGHSVEIYAK